MVCEWQSDGVSGAIANTTWVELGKTVEKFGLVGRSLSANKQRVRLAG